MCGRYSLIHNAAQIAARFDVEPLVELSPRYNIAPTQLSPVIRADEERGRRIDLLRWGLIPFWAKDMKVGARMINARSESAATKPAFRAAFKRRRCLIPVDGFYEWVEKGGKKWPIRITLKGGEEEREELGAFAGLWESWRDESGEVVESYTILTADAVPILQEVHHRMPVWAPEALWEPWLDEENPFGEQLVEAMIRGFPADRVELRPVSRELNRAGNEGAELIEMVDEPDLPLRMI